MRLSKTSAEADVAKSANAPKPAPIQVFIVFPTWAKLIHFYRECQQLVFAPQYRRLGRMLRLRPFHRGERLADQGVGQEKGYKRYFGPRGQIKGTDHALGTTCPFLRLKLDRRNYIFFAASAAFWTASTCRLTLTSSPSMSEPASKVLFQMMP